MMQATQAAAPVETQDFQKCCLCSSTTGWLHRADKEGQGSRPGLTAILLAISSEPSSHVPVGI